MPPVHVTRSSQYFMNNGFLVLVCCSDDEADNDLDDNSVDDLDDEVDAGHKRTAAFVPHLISKDGLRSPDRSPGGRFDIAYT